MAESRKRKITAVTISPERLYWMAPVMRPARSWPWPESAIASSHGPQSPGQFAQVLPSLQFPFPHVISETALMSKNGGFIFTLTPPVAVTQPRLSCGAFALVPQLFVSVHFLVLNPPAEAQPLQDVQVQFSAHARTHLHALHS